MSLMRGFNGVIALMGRAPSGNFPNFFGEAKTAFHNSLTAIGGSVLLILILTRSIIHLQRRAAKDAADASIPVLQIGITAAFYLLAFTLIAFMLSLIFDRREEYFRWATLRHWVVFYALMPVTLVAVLATAGIFPIVLANGLLFTAFIGWLFVDIRLAYKMGGLGFIGAVFAACMTHALGLSIILTAVVQMI